MKMINYILCVKDKNEETILAWEFKDYEEAVEKANEKRNLPAYKDFKFVLKKETITYETVEM